MWQATSKIVPSDFYLLLFLSLECEMGLIELLITEYGSSDEMPPLSFHLVYFFPWRKLAAMGW
jgi:hypothetical protein